MLSAQALRNWKLATYALTGITGFHVLFRTDYGPHEHALSPVQRWYNRTIDRMIGVDADLAERKREEDFKRRRQGLAAENRFEGDDSWTEGDAWGVGTTGARGDTAEGAAAVDELRRRALKRMEERAKMDKAKAAEQKKGGGDDKDEPIPGLRWRAQARERARVREGGIMIDAIAAERDEAKEEKAKASGRGWGWLGRWRRPDR
mmetsp:Transcript_29659/g.87970  ORF Transcript_29659/g.87970 Transcript_29659/m.87970 type:complete len:204 (-) Transcript_29659:177-788(-)